jgi:hypothetical protein
VCFGRGPSNHQGRWGEGGDPGVKSKGGGCSLWGFVHGFLGREKKLGGAVCALVRAPPTTKEDGGRGEIRA